LVTLKLIMQYYVQQYVLVLIHSSILIML